MKYKTCVSVAEKTPKRMNQALGRALKKSEYAELRLDFLRPIQVPDALDLARRNLKRCVCTLRPRSEGGVFSGTERERVSILKLIAEYRPYLIDVELSTMSENRDLAEYIKSTKTQVLVSWHDFKKTPKTAELAKKLREMRRFSSYVKMVTTAKSSDDASRILSVYGRSPKTSLIAFAMGDAGRISRILCLYLGSPYTYVSLGRAVAPGQFSADEVRRIAGLKSNQSLNQSGVKGR